MNKFTLLFLPCLFVFFLSETYAQNLRKIKSLDRSLSEISGMTFLNDTILVAHNDSGNKNFVYLLSLSGEIIRKVEIENAKNKDWEDICSDGKEYIYLGDIGNNSNKRKQFEIYKIAIDSLLKHSKTNAEIIRFSYPDQTAFPPVDSLLHYDAEALVFYRDSLYIFTKCRTVPFDGISFCYQLGTGSGDQIPQKQQDLQLGKRGFLKDAITAAEIFGDSCYLLTYNRMLIYSIENKQLIFKREHYFKPITQKESITTRNGRILYIADEKRKWMGGNLYYLKLKKK